MREVNDHTMETKLHLPFSGKKIINDRQGKRGVNYRR